ncbi:sensory neuron membrane protein 1-like [Euwallacea similis]|uniref:sensory neuron membrane protein 1-like n=1 Tax=Euwallacea similis TaxID=1736056 RepID=UPI00345041FA
MPPPKKIALTGGALAAGAVLWKIWLFGAILRFGIKDQTALRRRNEVRDIYLKLPFPLNFKIYFFNVTNPEEIQNGAKPIVTEVGPYWYDEIKEKVDVVDNDTEDSLTYTPYDVFRFNQNKSSPLKDDDYITIIHPVLVAMVNSVLRDSPVFLSIVNKSIPQIFTNPKTIFLTTRVKDVLFNGVELNCSSKEFGPNAICGQLKNQAPGLEIRQDNVFLFSILGPRNATLTTRLKVLRGISHYQDLGRLVEFNGKKSLNFWGSDQCNRYDGTDSWIFPPLMNVDEGLKSFSTDLCRNIKMKYISDKVFKKIPITVFESNLGDQSTEPEEKCYCRKEDSCLKKGLFDLTNCMGVPLYATLPHFLDTDENYMKLIEGMRPDREKHLIRVYLEPLTGSPLKAAKRMQFNLDLQQTKKVYLFSNLPAALFPIFWLEEV